MGARGCKSFPFQVRKGSRQLDGLSLLLLLDGGGAYEKWPWILLVSILSLSDMSMFIGIHVGQTNGANFELYALLGEAYGTGTPIYISLAHKYL